MSVKLLSREDLTAMAITKDETLLVYHVDGTDASEDVIDTAKGILESLDENAEKLREDSAYNSFDGKNYMYTLDEAKDIVWDCASICTQEDYLKEQAEIESERE